MNKSANPFDPLGASFETILSRVPSLDQLPDQDPDAKCSLCDGYGHIIDAEGKARPCTCVRKEIFASEIETARIPKLYAAESLETFQPYTSSLRGCVVRVKEYVEKYSPAEPRGLYICGSTGTGKTHLAIGILRGLIARGFDGVYYNVVDLLDAIRATYDPNAPGAPKGRLTQELNRQIFVLDDFGVQKTSTWVADRLYALINRRYQDCKTMIITSNIMAKDLPLKVENRLASRIIEMCNDIDIKADDYRLRRSKPPAGRRRDSSVR